MARLTRRAFLGTASMASAALALARTRRADRTHDVAVLGAGMAGLAAARDLSRAGLDVLVLEARDRVGGRMETLADVTPHGLEVGAQMVHGSRAHTWELLHELGTETRPFGDGLWSAFVWDESEGFREPRYEKTDAINARIVEAYQEYRGEDISYAAFLEKMALPERDRELVAESALSWAAEPDEMSLRAAIEDSAAWEIYLDRNYQVVGGYSGVAEAVAAKVGDGIRLGSVVRNIEWGRGDVTIHYDRDGKHERANARRVVVSLPIGVLQSGSPVFSPSLPAWKRRSIDALRMGRVVVVHILFDDYFWREHSPAVRGWSSRGGRIAFFDPHPEGKGTPVLFGWITGRPAQELSDLGQKAGTARALEWIRAAFGGMDVAKRVEWSNMRDWIADPYSLGCYSFTRPGGHGQRAVLGTPIQESLYFAGEATAPPPHYQTVHGAYASGRRAAREILASLGKDFGSAL